LVKRSPQVDGESVACEEEMRGGCFSLALRGKVPGIWHDECLETSNGGQRNAVPI
jgi:hypothetical protein